MNVLDQIVEAKRREVRRLSAADVRAGRGSPRDFRAALAAPGISVIAEIKRRSPSKGPLRPHLDPAELARAYESSGAAAISCLTDADYFGAQPGDLPGARAACGLPVLRKDFLIDPGQLEESLGLGADAVLLIVRILDDAALRDLLRASAELGLAALVEVHDAGELDRAVAAGAEIIGVNNRNLATFAVGLDPALRLCDRIPHGCLAVAESGIRTRGDVAVLEAAGYDAVLVGESLLRAESPGAALAELRGRSA